MAQQIETLPLQPLAPRPKIRIDVGTQAEGCTYALGPSAVAAIEHAFKGVRPARSIHVGYGTRGAFEQAHGPMWDQIVTLLTGLALDRLTNQFDVIIFDAASEKVVKKFPA